MHKFDYRVLFKQFMRFAMVGLSAFGIDYLIFLLLTYVFGVFYIAASAISFIIATVYNYAMSMRYVFQGKETQTAMQQFTIFSVLSIIGLGLNQFFLWACVGLFFIPEWISKVVATFLVTIYNFITRKIFLEDKGKRLPKPDASKQK